MEHEIHTIESGHRIGIGEELSSPDSQDCPTYQQWIEYKKAAIKARMHYKED